MNVPSDITLNALDVVSAGPRGSVLYKTKTDRRATASPTVEAYGELLFAYAHYNKTLFDDLLPPCLITLVRRKRTAGYFSHKRFVRLRDGTVATDEMR